MRKLLKSVRSLINLSTSDNLTIITIQFLKLLKIKFNKNDVKAQILEHPNYPSLVCVADTLEDYNVNVTAIKLEFKDLLGGVPFVAQFIDGDKKYFVIVKEINNTEIRIIDEQGFSETLSLDTFGMLWTGVALYGEPNQNYHLKTTTKQKLFSIIRHVFLTTLGLTALSLVIIGLINGFGNTGMGHTGLFYFAIKFGGLLAGLALLWFEVDRYNPILLGICSMGKNTSCSNVVSSKGSQLFKITNLSELTFSYFASGLILLVLSGITDNTIAILQLASLFGLPFVIYSLWYQGSILKQWCILCILTQFLLIAEISFATYYFDQIGTLDYMSAITFAVSFVLLILIWKSLIPVLKKSKEHRFLKKRLVTLKTDPNVFFSLLNQSDPIIQSPNNLGLYIGNPKAKHTIIKVCNPYCGPCAKAHAVLDKLVEQGKVYLQIIFTVPSNLDHNAILPAKHLLAISDLDNNDILKDALDNWYLSDNKDYDVFSIKYPMNGELNNQTNKLINMRSWCKIHQISHTPTLYLNNRRLPKGYSANDLKLIL